MNDSRRIRCDGEEIGTFSVDDLYRMRTRGTLDGVVDFWSDAKQQWMPIAGLMFDIESDRMPSLRSAGVKRVAIIGTGRSDCRACKSLQKTFAVDDAPRLPPEGCTCVPWCRLTFVAKE